MFASFSYFSAPNLKSDSDSDFSPSNSEEEDEHEDEEEKREKSETQPKTPSKTSTVAAALYKTPAKKSKKAPEVGFCWFLMSIENIEGAVCVVTIYLNLHHFMHPKQFVRMLLSNRLSTNL